ncbi:hypothetical protein CKAN_01225700 [Cinnamomum micranthum f. kanehirae]|uniref:Uncharacterized protein n=1 Tax=Cinnamomum micranthum f. kanehirae TaxID=337451 RepID=A0A3S3MP08_9MAGN|nr:hypothetical protein CKAN_01225700 [Cinnamomum micranthum f. kanehirae]
MQVDEYKECNMGFGSEPAIRNHLKLSPQIDGGKDFEMTLLSCKDSQFERKEDAEISVDAKRDGNPEMGLVVDQINRHSSLFMC